MPLVFEENFEQGADRWQPTDPAAWEVFDSGSSKVYRQGRASKYQPPHRSPLNIALFKEAVVGDFTLDAKVRSTVRDYGHRDACLFFGYQDPAHFYYVHLGKQADDHANQIFLVNDAPRVKISTTSTEGTPWDDEWHAVRIERTVKDGSIKVYFDDLEHPVMTATDKHFTWGQVGIGSFDDTTDWDDIRLRGEVVDPPTR
ncbi:MAG: hypothetical protein KF708_11350 [Pirellulales bacterium]|nr:hypothetical protein [Pirellulales bacterium]